MAQRALSNVIFIIVINLMLGGVSTGIDNWGHMGGLLGGTFFAWFAGPLFVMEGGSLDPRIVDERDQSRALIVGVLDFAIFAVLAAMKILRGYLRRPGLGKFRRALLKEGLYAFFVFLAFAGNVLQIALVVQDLF